jgi:superfamily I DNA/RNA helicase
MTNAEPQKTPAEIRDEITKEVLNHDYSKGPLLLNAGPGTGKTFNIIETIKKQLPSRKLDDFFVFSLTNAIVGDFETEARKKIDGGFDKVSTLHFRAKGIVHKFAESVGWGAGFDILSDLEREVLIEDVHQDLKMKGIRVDLDDLKRVTVKEHQKASSELKAPHSDFSIGYTALQRFYSLMDWYDLMKYACEILSSNTDAKSEQCARQQFIMVDEYQDLNVADRELLRLLCDCRHTLLVVGDPYQSIYSGRFADPTGIRNFHVTYPTRVEKILPVCSRCPTRVLKAAFNLISKNPEFKDTKPLIALPDTNERAQSGMVCAVGSGGSKLEAQFLAGCLRQLQDAGIPPEKVLVLAGSRELGDHLFDQVHETDKTLAIQNCLKKEPIVIDIVEHLVEFLEDKSANFALRMILARIAGLKVDKIAVLRKSAFDNKCSLWEAVNLPDAGKLIKRSKPVLDEFIEVVKRTIELSLDDGLNLFAKEYPAIADQVNRFLEEKAAKEAKIEGEPVDDVERVEEREPITGYRFMTLHSSKGLETDFVFIPFMEKDIEFGRSGVEEERRLLYVGLTRAKVSVVFTWAKVRTVIRHKAGGGPQSRRGYSPHLTEIGLSGSASAQKVLEALKARAQHVVAFDKANAKNEDHC